MLLIRFIQLISRHLVLAVAGFTVALGIGADVFFVSHPDYEIHAKFLFVSPSRDADGKIVNPFLDLGNAVPSLADVVATELSAPEAVSRFTASYPGADVSAVRDAASKAPIIDVAVSAPEERAASAALDSISRQVDTTTSTIQRAAGVPDALLVRASMLTRDTRATAVYTVPIRNGILAAVGGLATALLVLILAERSRARSAIARGQRIRETLTSPAARSEQGDAERGSFDSQQSRVTPIEAHRVVHQTGQRAGSTWDR